MICTGTRRGERVCQATAINVRAKRNDALSLGWSQQYFRERISRAHKVNIEFKFKCIIFLRRARFAFA